MNEYDIEEALRSTAQQELPNLRQAAEVLSRLKDWVNSCSDGWPYWNPPRKASSNLQGLLTRATLYKYGARDCTEAEVKRAITPVKAFLTRQNVDPDIKARIVG